MVKLSSTPPATLSVQIGDGATDATDASSTQDSDDEGGIWRTQSAEVSFSPSLSLFFLLSSLVSFFFSRSLFLFLNPTSHLLIVLII